MRSPVIAATLLASLAFPAPARADSTPAGPWSANLTLYTWMPGVGGKFSAGPLNRSVQANFIDIAGKLRNFPMAFMGRLEGHYDRFGLYLDGNYLDLDFKPRFDNGVLKGLHNEIGLIEYGAMYRLFGPAPAERVGRWEEPSRSNALDLYLGGRTLLLDNRIEARGYGSASAGRALTSPLIGGRATVEFGPSWFVTVDGSIGGFGADDVDFAGSVMGVVGYKTRFFGWPVSVEAGYKALRLDVEKRSLETRATLGGALVGFTGYW